MNRRTFILSLSCFLASNAYARPIVPALPNNAPPLFVIDTKDQKVVVLAESPYAVKVSPHSCPFF